MTNMGLRVTVIGLGNNPVQEYTLTDFRLAGFLVVRGAKFLGTVRNDSNEVVFRFAPIPDPQDILCQYPASPEASYDAACRNMHEFVKLTSKQASKIKYNGKE